jgi:hypothetical protein
VILSGRSVPRLEKIPIEPEYNIPFFIGRTGGQLGDTTKEPLPELTSVVTPDILNKLDNLPVPQRIEPKPKVVIPPKAVPSKAVSSTPIVKPKEECPKGQGKLGKDCVPAERILKELSYWSQTGRRKEYMLRHGKSKYRSYMSNLRNLAQQYKIASGKTFNFPPEPSLSMFESIKYGFSK